MFLAMRRSAHILLLLLLAALAAVPAAVGAAGKASGTVNVQILAVNDFHGNLLPPTGSSGRVGTIDAGGAQYLATHIKQLEATNPENTTVVSAGDLIGASPLLSALFHDEPTIEAFNQIGLDFNAVGNHEFDEGSAELLRMQNGGCHPVDGCLDGDDFAGADFQFLAANVVRKNGKTLFPAYKIRSFGGAKVAFIGLTLEGTPLIVTPSGIAGLTFKDEADTINALVPQIKAQGINTIVVLIHEGGTPSPGTNVNGCGVSGPIVDIVNRTLDDVDLFITGHTHQPYNCVIDDRPVSSAFSFGRLVTDIDMTIDRQTGEPVPGSISVNNKIITRDVQADAGITALINKYTPIYAPLANRVIGSISADITRAATATGESALGDVIADAQLAATADATTGNAVIAFMNPGGIRTDLTYAGSPAGEGDGYVTYSEMFNVQPFGNNLVTKTLTGEQIRALLQQQFVGCGQTANRILQISEGFSYEQNAAGVTCADKIGKIFLNGSEIGAATAYRVTMNSFLADGGDGFSVFTQGTNVLGGAVDTDAFEAYFAANSPVEPGPRNRITTVTVIP
jgi:5'-nucleotidase